MKPLYFASALLFRALQVPAAENLAQITCLDGNGSPQVFTLETSQAPGKGAVSVLSQGYAIWLLEVPSLRASVPKPFDAGALVCDGSGRLLVILAATPYPLVVARVFSIPTSDGIGLDLENVQSTREFGFHADRDACLTEGVLATKVGKRLEVSVVRQGTDCQPMSVNLDLETFAFSGLSARASEPRDHYLPFLSGLRDFASGADRICRVRVTRAAPDGYFESGNLSTAILVESLRGRCPDSLNLEWSEKSSVRFSTLGEEFLLFLFPIDDGFGAEHRFNPAVGTAQRILGVETEEVSRLEVLDPSTLALVGKVPEDLQSPVMVHEPLLGETTIVERRLVQLTAFRNWLTTLKPQAREGEEPSPVAGDEGGSFESLLRNTEAICVVRVQRLEDADWARRDVRDGNQSRALVSTSESVRGQCQRRLWVQDASGISDLTAQLKPGSRWVLFLETKRLSYDPTGTYLVWDVPNRWNLQRSLGGYSAPRSKIDEWVVHSSSLRRWVPSALFTAIPAGPPEPPDSSRSVSIFLTVARWQDLRLWLHEQGRGIPPSDRCRATVTPRNTEWPSARDMAVLRKRWRSIDRSDRSALLALSRDLERARRVAGQLCEEEALQLYKLSFAAEWHLASISFSGDETKRREFWACMSLLSARFRTGRDRDVVRWLHGKCERILAPDRRESSDGRNTVGQTPSHSVWSPGP